MKGTTRGPLAQAVFTPGPWSVRHAVCRNDHPDTSADVHGRDGQFVADCGCHEQATPNATLIAAAPDLYEALRLLLHEVNMSGNAHARDFGWPRAVRASVAALAKAEGRSAAPAAPSIASDPAPSEGAAPHATEKQGAVHRGTTNTEER